MWFPSVVGTPKPESTIEGRRVGTHAFAKETRGSVLRSCISWGLWNWVGLSFMLRSIHYFIRQFKKPMPSFLPSSTSSFLNTFKSTCGRCCHRDLVKTHPLNPSREYDWKGYEDLAQEAYNNLQVNPEDYKVILVAPQVILQGTLRTIIVIEGRDFVTYFLCKDHRHYYFKAFTCGQNQTWI